ncbi:MAG TPA: aspartate 1-decarboxylase [Thermoanaerobaculia bacterium]|jgi:aspartate 1-decarboxylase|nr:aspartate 1-decarboxylase [Thermoanaerobaculia bacterium]
MKKEVLRGKIHRATVTQAEVDYEGSIGIDAALLEAAAIEPYDRVEVYDVTRGSRFSTYAIEAPEGSGTISVNGAAARLVEPGDLVIIAAYGTVEVGEPRPAPALVFVDRKNAVSEIKVRELQGVSA